jgi:hypothetical protein
MKMEQRECSEKLAYEIQTPGNHPKVRLRYSEHGESLKSRITPLQAWRGPEGSRRLRFPDFKTVGTRM